MDDPGIIPEKDAESGLRPTIFTTRRATMPPVG
jgi:hypothetical protein